MKYLDCLSGEVEGVLKNILPEKLGIHYDAWDDGNSTNYFDVFVIWWDEKRQQNRVYLLRLCPLVRPDDYGADSHLESIEKFLANLGKMMDT
jgi:hypothetical protein